MAGPYPKRKYHKTQPSIVVCNEQEEFLAGGGYYNAPIQEADKAAAAYLEEIVGSPAATNAPRRRWKTSEGE
jgi:hypothetical protein